MSTFFYAFPHNCESSRSNVLSPPRQLIDCRVFIKSLWSDGPWQLAPSYNLYGLTGLRFRGANVGGGRTVNFLTVAVAFFFSFFFRTNMMPVLAFKNWRPVWFLLFCTLNNENSVFTNSGTLSPLISPTPGTPTGPLYVFDFLKIPPAALCVSPFLSVSVTTSSANSQPSFPHFLRSQSKFLTGGLTRESHCVVWQTQHR